MRKKSFKHIYRLLDDLSDHRFKMCELQGIVFRIKRTLIPSLTEINASLIVPMPPVSVPEISVFVHMVEMVVTLKQSMVLESPVVPITDIRT